MKVMHVLNTGGYSGAENVVITMINAMRGDVDSVYVSPEGLIREQLASNGIKYYPIKKNTILEIRRAIKELKPDIIHAHDYTAGIVCAMASGRTVVINHIHNNAPWLKKICVKSLLFFVSCTKNTWIITVSDSVMNEYVWGRLFVPKTTVIGNPIDVDRIKRLSKESAEERSYDIAFLGRFTPPKNLFYFLELVGTIKKLKSDISVEMIGTGELFSEIQEKIVKENLEDNIDLKGFQNNPYPYLCKAKVLLMPSTWEGYGLAAVEALALGLPVVCSNVGGLPGIVNDDCGKVCNNTQEYVEEILKLLSDNDYYHKKSEKAVIQADSFDNPSQYKEKIIKLYMKAANDL